MADYHVIAMFGQIKSAVVQILISKMPCDSAIVDR